MLFYLKTTLQILTYIVKATNDMIYLNRGTTASIWLSLREEVPFGCTSSNFELTFTNNVSGEVKTLNPIDLQPNNKFSNFNILVDTPEDLPNGIIDMVAGMWDYVVKIDETVLEIGKVLVSEPVKAKTTLTRPNKTKSVLRR